MKPSSEAVDLWDFLYLKVMKDTIISVFKELYKSKDVPYNVPLYKVLERIRVGKSIEIVNKVRSAKTKDEADLIKSKLPCIIFGGEFRERNKNGLLKHSGLAVIDFDKYPDDKTMLDHFNLLKLNKHILSLFISPSGKGIKGVFKIPVCNQYEHEKYFKAFDLEFQYDYFDKSNCNIDRVCFESYDPNIYINYDAEIYSPNLIDNGYKVKDKVPLIPINDEDLIIEKIMKFDWKKDFREGERNNFIFDLAGAFCEYGINESMALNYIMNNVIIGSFSETEAKNTIKSAYKLRSYNSKYFENYQQIDKIKTDLKKGKKEVLNKYNILEEVYNEIKESAEIEDFWYITVNQKTGNEKININPLKYKLFLERNGFKKHFPNESDKPQFVSINSNKVNLTSVSKIKDFVLDYLMERKELDVWNYCANYQNLFSELFLLMIESIDLIMLKDDRFTSYLAFKNGILKVTKDKADLIDYLDVEGYIWESHILERDYIFYSENENDYKKFIYNISNKEPFAVECTIGYLLSTYKNRSNNKAIILNDEIISENPEGGTGKGLFVQGLSQIRNTSIIDGKQFDSKKSFAYQTVSLDTKILVFDDVKKNFDFEDKFSLVTEGMTLERKNKDAIKLNVHDSPKILLSTNYAIKGEGNSHNRRRHEIEIAQYYGQNLTPEDEFGKELFDEWDETDFNKFDCYMIECLQKYLSSGLVKQNAKNIKLRKFIAETSMEFYEWAKEIENLPLDVRNEKTEYFNKFTDEYKDFQKWLQRKKFNVWIQKFCSFNNYNYVENNTNGQRWFMLATKEVDLKEIDNDIAF
jgi:hypothetical protein